MSTLALSHPAPLRPDWNWPRVGALSGALSLHLLALALLLAPAAALHLLPPRAEEKVTARLIDAAPPIPDEPKPAPIVAREKLPKPRPAPVRPPPRAPADVASALPEPLPAADPSPPPRDEPAATALETPPAALAYRTRTRVPYPMDALRRREQGTVILRVLVGSDGLPQAVEIERSSGSRSLDDAARDAVRRWTFLAATHGGVATAVWARVPVKFDLLQL